MAWLRTYDITTPDGSVDDPAEAADRMNEIKLATQEREDVDHYWPLTGSEVSDLEAGEHRKFTIRTLTVIEVAALVGAKSYLYRLVTDGELYFKDAAGNTIKLTEGGKILSASLDMLDEDNMVSDSNTHASTQQSIKAYIDVTVAAAAAAAAAALAAAVPNDDSFGPWAVKANNTVYLAASAGFVCANKDAAVFEVLGYTDAANPPTTIRRGGSFNDVAGGRDGITMPVIKGDYWKVTGATTIFWMPVGA